MNFKRYQDTFDKIKWEDGVRIDADPCGSYAFCGYCDKTEKYPCARAADRMEQKNNGRVRIAGVRSKKAKK